MTLFENKMTHFILIPFFFIRDVTDSKYDNFYIWTNKEHYTKKDALSLEYPLSGEMSLTQKSSKLDHA